jgi:hypothetical protein
VQVVTVTPEGINIEIDRSKEDNTEDSVTTSNGDDDEEFVMAEDEMESDDEDFVDILEEDFDVTSVN